MKQYRIVRKKDGKFYPQVKGWWGFWMYYLSSNLKSRKWFYYQSECDSFLEREAEGDKIIKWAPKCKS